MHTARFVVSGYTHPPQIPYTQYSTPQKDMVAEIPYSPLNRMTDRRLWKHYLPATTVAYGKNWNPAPRTILLYYILFTLINTETVNYAENVTIDVNALGLTVIVDE